MKTLIALTHMPRLVMAAILGPLAFGCATVCMAGDNGAVPQAMVKASDLDLSSAYGAATLYSRIMAAADEVCSSSDTDSRYLPDLLAVSDCVHSTVRSAVAKIGHPALSAIYNARYRDSLPILVATARKR